MCVRTGPETTAPLIMAFERARIWQRSTLARKLDRAWSREVRPPYACGCAGRGPSSFIMCAGYLYICNAGSCPVNRSHRARYSESEWERQRTGDESRWGGARERHPPLRSRQRHYYYDIRRQARPHAAHSRPEKGSEKEGRSRPGDRPLRLRSTASPRRGICPRSAEIEAGTTKKTRSLDERRSHVADMPRADPGGVSARRGHGRQTGRWSRRDPAWHSWSRVPGAGAAAEGQRQAARDGGRG